MKTNYGKMYSTIKTPQNQQVPGRDQIKNEAGGYVFKIGDWERLNRFIITGAENTYYCDAQTLTIQNADCIRRCLAEDGKRVVDTIIRISDAGLAPRNDPAIFALAVVCAFGDDQSKQAAFSALSTVCRIPTHLFHFAEYVSQMRGWGRGLRTAIASWYLSMSIEKLSYEIIKYQSRDAWSNRDLLCLSHPKTDGVTNDIFKYIVTGNVSESLPQIILGFEQAKKATNVKDIVALIKTVNLPRECVPTQFLKEPVIWGALLDQRMPVGAMLRNLGNMTKCGLIVPMSDALNTITSTLTNVDILKKGRVHPLSLLVALNQYAAGHGLRSDSAWPPVQQVVDALNDAFYLSFSVVEPMNKRLVLAVDTSGSMMSGECAGMTGISPRVGSAALGLVTANTESNYVILGFSDFVEQLSISPKMRLDDVINKFHGPPHGTDCSLPIIWTAEHNISVDAFVLYTDNQTWAGGQHPYQALQEYRRKTGINAKMVAVAMTATDCSICDPLDAGSFNVAGFSADAPSVISSFVRGEI